MLVRAAVVRGVAGGALRLEELRAGVSLAIVGASSGSALAHYFVGKAAREAVSLSERRMALDGRTPMQHRAARDTPQGARGGAIIAVFMTLRLVWCMFLHCDAYCGARHDAPATRRITDLPRRSEYGVCVQIALQRPSARKWRGAYAAMAWQRCRSRHLHCSSRLPTHFSTANLTRHYY